MCYSRGRSFLYTYSSIQSIIAQLYVKTVAKFCSIFENYAKISILIEQKGIFNFVLTNEKNLPIKSEHKYLKKNIFQKRSFQRITKSDRPVIDRPLVSMGVA